MNTQRIGIFLALFLAAAIFIFFHCCFSPGDTLHGHADPACFYMDGKAVAHGYIPFIDVIDVKGPLLFFFYALGYLLGGTLGIAALFMFTLFFTLAAFYKIAELYIPNKGICLFAALLPLLPMLSPALDACGRAEEIVLPFLAWSAYFSLSYIKKQDCRRSLIVASFFLGISGSVAFLIKYNIGLPIFLLWACVFLSAYTTQKRRGGLCIVFCTAGFLLVLLPVLVYLLSTHSLQACYDVYFRLNVDTYNLADYPVCNKILSLFFRSVVFPASILCLYTKPFSVVGSNQKCSDRKMLLILAIGSIFCCVGGREYYYIIATPTFLFVSIALFQPLAQVYTNFKSRYAVVLTPLIVVSFFCITKDAERTMKNLFQEKSEKFCTLDKVINRYHEPKILYINWLDCGLGVKADALPACPEWALLTGAPDYFRKQQREAVESGKADFVVTTWTHDSDLIAQSDGTALPQLEWLKKNHYVFRCGQGGLDLYQKEVANAAE